MSLQFLNPSYIQSFPNQGENHLVPVNNQPSTKHKALSFEDLPGSRILTYDNSNSNFFKDF